MDPAYVHLVLNHFPVIGVLLASALLAVALWRKSGELEVVASVAILLLSAMTIPVYLSGGSAEEPAEELADVSGRLLHEHEDAGQFALIAGCATALLALVHLALIRRRRAAPRAVAALLLLAGLFTFATLVRTAQLGGQARHPEIRDASAYSGGENEDEDAD